MYTQKHCNDYIRNFKFQRDLAHTLISNVMTVEGA
jgi:hypothetical protein